MAREGVLIGVELLVTTVQQQHGLKQWWLLVSDQMIVWQQLENEKLQNVAA